MGNRVQGKVAIVTGAGSDGPGIGNGRAAAMVYAREGARVMLVDRNLAAAELTREMIEQEEGECFAFEADVSRAADCRAMAQACIANYGSIDILQNNVAIPGDPGGPVEVDESSWDAVMTVNVKSVFLTGKYVSRDVAIQYASKGIRSNTILIGGVFTPRIVSERPGVDVDDLIRQRASKTPSGRLGDAFDPAYAALFLASDEASHITGTTLMVDGGKSAYMDVAIVEGADGGGQAS